MRCPLRPTIVAATTLTAFAATAAAQGVNFTAPPGVTVLDTDSTTIVTSAGPLTVTGGVFVLDTVTIPAGSTVRARGSKPLLFLVQSMLVDGVLSADGEDGEMVMTLQSAGVPAAGGRGGPAGGDGGRGSPQIALRTTAGQPGNGPGNVPAMGGTGGLLSWVLGCNRGSGGGGGAFATIGDPWFKTPAGTGTSFVQRNGSGGFGCVGSSGTTTRTLTGGGPGGVVFVDASANNDFLGYGYDFATQTLILGELTLPLGGAGGGGGGDYATDNLLLSPAWPNDAKGGGGGGGGGCLIVAAQNNIVVGPFGRITANGGHGGGGEQAGSCNFGGGGGGGSGGLLVLAARGTIVLHVKGETYANNDYDFVLAADGGVCRTGPFLSPTVPGKYPSNGATTIAGAVYDERPLGGFGGMGIVQLMTRPGLNLDQTNTRLDDNIDVIRNGLQVSGALKQRYLAWRGFRNAQGVPVDDAGVPTNIGNSEGDIRPTPVLLPVF